MKNHFILALLLFTFFNGFGQISFEAGYFIDNDDQRVNCLIKNIEWKNNPTSFEYKLSETSGKLVGKIDGVKEFGIGSNSKYRRFDVKIDRSSDKVENLTSQRKAEFEDETFFLKTIIEGAATLYHYEDGSLNRYFYNVDDSEVTQLVYKRYLITEASVGRNNRYRQQLANDLKCKTSVNIDKLEYQKAALRNLFEKYNGCVGADYIVYNKRQKGESFRLILKPGLRLNSLDLGRFSNFKVIQFQNELAFDFGISAEFVLSFNKNKWSAILEPTFQYFKAEEETTEFTGTIVTTSVDYKSIEIPAGIRHYIFLNNDFKIFMNGFVEIDFPFDTEIIFKSGGLQTYTTPQINFAVGAGFVFKSKYSFEVRYATKRNLLNDYINYNADFKGIKFLFGYRIL